MSNIWINIYYLEEEFSIYLRNNYTKNLFPIRHVCKFWKDFGTLELGLKVCF